MLAQVRSDRISTWCSRRTLPVLCVALTLENGMYKRADKPIGAKTSSGPAPASSPAATKLPCTHLMYVLERVHRYECISLS
jgi:hypothetical protein